MSSAPEHPGRRGDDPAGATIAAGVHDAAGTTGAAGAKRVLFVCTHNSARSIMAEALLRHHGGDTYDVHSAGTHPDDVRPLTLRVIEEAGLPTEGLHSESIDGFLGQRFDAVVTVCDSARRACPAFPGEGERLHWDVDDPSAASGTEDERLAVFRRAFSAIGEHVRRFIAVDPRSGG